ncbi:hypothetical protein BK659_20325 [Pseudomonas brassicacearum]|uniref:glutathione transferase n=1 Tax=Pseudomonas brassicacearum TaxID=930166 RepID=A0A423H3D1_9PSED|nr:glutathione S-transferase N-terminal domain-containing protein [Pseudomonas brassicacearum]RON06639.1 hypothetical protein BK659_20325 [Pseudomonas brassicacearum]
MILIGNESSACTRSVLMVLAEKNTPVEFISVDLSTGAHKADEHLALNPFGKVPVLLDGEVKIYESQAINRYLDARLPGISLVPKDLAALAKMDQWLSVDACYFTPPAYSVVFQKIFLPMFGGQSDLSIIQEAEEKLKAVYSAMDKTLENSSFLAGEELTLADLAFVQYTDYLLQAKCESVVFAHDNIRRWWHALSQRASYKNPLAMIQ